MKRTIKSFVLRGGRVSKRQMQAYEMLLEKYSLPLASSVWDLNTVFGRDAETFVEIGFGMGASLVQMASLHLDFNFIGIEVHRAGIGACTADLDLHGLTNVKIAESDAVEVFRHQIKDDSLAGVLIFFPDPWPKKRHHKRRLIQAEFINLVLQKLKIGGVIHCATDWQEYADWISLVLEVPPGLSSCDGDFLPRLQTRPLTKFEKRGQALGHGVWDFVYRKIATHQK